MTTPGALDTATAVLAHARELAGSDWDVLDGPDTVAAVESITEARSLLDAALLRGITHLEATDALRELGWASPKDFLTHLPGGHKGTGGGLIRATEQLRDLPAVQAALDSGQVTLPQARAIASKVHTLPRVPEFREQVAAAMLDLVATEGLDATDLQTAFGDVVRTLDPDAAIVNAEKERVKAERGAHHARHLRFTEDGHGGVKLTGYGTLEDAEKIKTTLHPLAAPATSEPGTCGGTNRQPGEPMFDDHGVSTQTPCLTPGCGHDGRDPRDAGARLWDALVDACDRLANSDDLPRDHGTKPRVIVLIDQDSLRQQVIDAGLVCLTSARPVVVGSEGVEAERATKERPERRSRVFPRAGGVAAMPTWPPAVLDACAAARRDEGATRSRHEHCDAHHVTHWADGGPTALSNLVMVCRHHHTVLHHTPWAIHIDLDTGQPVWTPPPRATLTSLHGKITYHPARPRAA